MPVPSTAFTCFLSLGAERQRATERDRERSRQQGRGDGGRKGVIKEGKGREGRVGKGGEGERHHMEEHGEAEQVRKEAIWTSMPVERSVDSSSSHHPARPCERQT